MGRLCLVILNPNSALSYAPKEKFKELVESSEARINRMLHNFTIKTINTV